MKKLLVLGLFGVMMAFGTMAFPVLVHAETQQTSGVVQKCPKCGAPMTEGHMHADEEEGLPFSVGTDHAFLSKYIWRGINVTDDPVWQPDAWISAYGFTFNVWGNMDLTDVNGNETEFNEVDYTLDYSGSFDKLSYSAGLIHYVFPNTSYPTTTEVYGSLGYDVILQPSVSLYWDFDEADGMYGTLGIGHSFELPEISDMVSMSLDLGTHVGFATKSWNNYYYGADHTAFVDYVIGASLPIGIGDHITIAPTLSYTTVLDRTLNSKASNEHTLVGGVVISAEL